MYKKHLALLLALLLTVLCFTSCSKETDTPTATEAPAAEVTATDVLATEAPTDEASATQTPVAKDSAAETTLAEAVEVTPSTVIARMGDQVVTYGEVYDEIRTEVAAYASYYAQYGQAIDVTDESLQNYVAQEIISTNLYIKVLCQKADELGLAHTDEELAAIKANAQVEYDNLVANYTSYVSMYSTDPADVEAQVNALLDEYGYTPEYIEEQLRISDLFGKLKAFVTDDITITEDEVRAAFDAKVETLKAEYDADPDAYLSAYLNGESSYYRPDGVRLVQQIFVAKTDAELSADEGATPDEATTGEATTGEAVLAGREKITAAKAEIDAGASFADVAVSYTEDGSATDELLGAGYPVLFGSELYDPSFVDNAMALKAIGDVSGIVETSYGYHLLRYAGDLAGGSLEFDSVKDDLTQSALTEKKDNAYAEQQSLWLSEDELQFENLDLVIEKAEVIPAAEAQLIFASVNTESQLTNLPGGTALYDLGAGVTLSVEGYITVEDVQYAYVTTLGSTAMGYVPADVLSPISQEDAEANILSDGIRALDVDAQAMNPIFTIAMNDGSLMYGELYPQMAPESVGNFVALANSDYYAGLIFHRVISGFMIQGGDPAGNGSGGPGYSIAGEFSANDVENTLSHARGVLSMARSSEFDSAGSQFFICHADSTFLDTQYAGFGMLLGGFDTLDAIASVATSSDKPVTDQIMKLVHVETYGVEYPFTKITD